MLRTFILTLSLFCASHSFAMNSNDGITEDKILQTIEKILNTQTQAPKPSKLLKEEFKIAIDNAHAELTSPDFQILDPNSHLGICQLIAWYSYEVMEEVGGGVYSIDQFILLALSSSKEKLGERFSYIEFEQNLRRLGFLKGKISRNQMEVLLYAFHAWLGARAMIRLGLEPSNHLAFERPKSFKVNVTNSLEINEKLFTSVYRKTPLLIAYHEGIPSQQNVMTYNTVSRLFVLAHDGENWKVQTHLEHIVRKGDGLTIVRKSEKSFAMSQDPDAVADERDMEEVDLPIQGKNYAVVHLGNFLPTPKDFDQSVPESLGFTDTNFEDLFLYKKISPLSIYHFNTIKNFDLKVFEAGEHYSHMKAGGFSFDFGGGMSTRDPEKKKNNPIGVAIHRRQPMYGDLGEKNPGYSLSYTRNGHHFLLRMRYLLDEEDQIIGIDHNTTVFLRKVTLTYRDCYIAYGNWRSPNIEDWIYLMESLKPYIYSDFVPFVKEFLKHVGITSDNYESWLAYGIQFIENGKKVVEHNYDFHHCPTNTKDIERTDKQRPQLLKVRKTLLHNGHILESKVTNGPADADSIFKLINTTREKYIQSVVNTVKNRPPNPYLITLIREALEENKYTLETVDKWADIFDNPKYWVSIAHLRVIAELFDFSFLLYELNGSKEHENFDMFFPLNAEGVDIKIGTGSKEVHLGLVNKHFIDMNRCHRTFQFEEITFSDQEKLKASITYAYPYGENITDNEEGLINYMDEDEVSDLSLYDFEGASNLNEKL